MSSPSFPYLYHEVAWYITTLSLNYHSIPHCQTMPLRSLSVIHHWEYFPNKMSYQDLQINTHNYYESYVSYGYIY